LAGKFHGKGIYKSQNGITQDGYWREDKFIGNNPETGWSTFSEVADTIKLELTESNIFEIPLKINNSLDTYFIFDSGASETQIDPILALTLIQNKTLSENDFLDESEYIMADGRIIKSSRINIREIRIGSRVLKNVSAAISEVGAPLLLGQNVISKFGKYTIDYEKGVMIINHD
jgi:aspartyl protease family protein